VTTDGSIIYHRTPRRKPIYRILGLAFFLLGAWMVLGGVSGEATLIERLVGVVAFGCAAFCAWMVGKRINRRHRVYAIDHDGFALFGPDGKRALNVDWKEVQGIGVSDFGYGKVLTFAFRNPDEVKARMNPDQRSRADANEAAGIPTLTIQQGAIDSDVDEIRTTSTRFFFAVG